MTKIRKGTLIKNSTKKLPAIALIRKHEGRYWGTVRLYKQELLVNDSFCYDTTFFKTIKEVKDEIKAFCQFKNMKIIKYISDCK